MNPVCGVRGDEQCEAYQSFAPTVEKLLRSNARAGGCSALKAAR
jgi:hypothetical protein